MELSLNSPSELSLQHPQGVTTTIASMSGELHNPSQMSTSVGSQYTQQQQNNNQLLLSNENNRRQVQLNELSADTLCHGTAMNHSTSSDLVDHQHIITTSDPSQTSLSQHVRHFISKIRVYRFYEKNIRDYPVN